MSNGNSSLSNSYWLCPLYCFNCYSESIDLAQGIQIKRIPGGFANFLRGHYSDWSLAEGSGSDTAALPKYMFVLPSTATGEDLASPFREMSKECNLLFDLVTALRLCHAGELMPGPFVFAELQDSEFYIPKMHEFIFHWTHVLAPVSRTTIGFELFWLSNYEFRQADVSHVNRLMGRLCACRMAGKPSFLPNGKTVVLTSVLDEALKRFNSAYHGESEDRLIDQMIAFESLYIADDKELGYKLALRTAFLLAKGEGNRKVIFSNMKKAYDLRSKVVHGGKQVKFSELENIIPKMEEYLRQSIQRFLALLPPEFSLEDLKKGKAKMLAKLDENIFSNGALLNSHDPRK